jgi:threonine aldolase
MIDLRSDTVTLPTPAMIEAMSRAELGDDVFHEDPTINRLETLAAELTGKAAAVFVPSGTMGNLASLLAHAGRGQEVIVGDEAHIYHYEAGGASALGGLVYHPVPTRPDGTLSVAAIEAAIRPWARDYHAAPPGVICLENTHNRCSGAVLTPDYLAEVAALADARGLPVHLDGARIFNAAIALGRPVTHLTRHVASMQICLSKGLAAPVGSLIVGDADFVDRARRIRKMLGGGMRQAGVLAAAGIVALTQMVDRLADDHANARVLADGLAGMPGIDLDPASIRTNIVIFRMPDAGQARTLVDAARREGVLLWPFGANRVRAVTHYGISADDCHAALAMIRRALDRVTATA